MYRRCLAVGIAVDDAARVAINMIWIVNMHGWIELMRIRGLRIIWIMMLMICNLIHITNCMQISWRIRRLTSRIWWALRQGSCQRYNCYKVLFGFSVFFSFSIEWEISKRFFFNLKIQIFLMVFVYFFKKMIRRN